MDYSESDIRDKLIEKLLNLGYPKSSIVLEFKIFIGRNRKIIDLAVIDPDTNKVLAIFEIKRNSESAQSGILQLISYRKIINERILCFLYILSENKELVYVVNADNSEYSILYDLPSFESLRNIELNTNESTTNNFEKKKNTARKFSSIVAGVSASIAITMSVSMLAGLFTSEHKTLNNADLTSKIETIENRNKVLVNDINLMKNNLSKLQNDIVSMSTIPEGQEWRSEAADIKRNVTDLSNRLSALENALTTDPSKALAIPILRKDLDNAEKNLNAELLQTRAEIDRMYDQNKWFIGLMISIAVSVLGIAASSFFNKKDT